MDQAFCIEQSSSYFILLHLWTMMSPKSPMKFNEVESNNSGCVLLVLTTFNVAKQDDPAQFEMPFGFVRSHIKLYIQVLSLIHISEPTRRTPISYAVFCLKKKKFSFARSASI
eukprot:TRINITY_DN1703_c0_g1_i6.p3 TRINITY_DN1703_c0_g1~~TRINITY_DN1703_c0_g1_i6.p3  ORF type:complete len:113 (+),score=6.63 TRINITY_DN1703_c0_g1_i6:965-1303(+)